MSTFNTATASSQSAVHTAVLALVWMAIATSGFVFSEPCPTDILTIALIVLLPTIGLTRIGPALSTLMLAMSAAAGFGLVACLFAVDLPKALTHTVVTIFVYGATIILAGFIAAKPVAHSKLIFNALTVAALIAAGFGVGGYFGLLPGGELFTKYGRASGTFKDPNVFGPFLVAPLLYALHNAMERPLKQMLKPLLIAGFLALGVFFSFSRGAWINLIAAVSIFLVLSLLTTSSKARLQKIAFLSIFGATLIGAAVFAALQIEHVSRLVTERASVTQNYDVGPEGRFGGQEKAIQLILDHPFGIGAAQFALVHHHEEAHNVYLSMAMNAGWLGAMFYMVIVLSTLYIGFSRALKPSPAQPFLIIAIATFAANAGEGIIIDTDHWRHVYLLMAFVWGIATARETTMVSAHNMMRRAEDKMSMPGLVAT